MKKNESGFSVVEVLIIIVVIGLIGAVGWLVWDRSKSSESKTTSNSSNQASPESQNEEPEVAAETCEPPAEWDKYTNPDHGQEYYYPGNYLVEEGGMGDIYSTSVMGPDNAEQKDRKSIFNDEALYWENEGTIGNGFGSLDALLAANNSGGAKAVAELSRQINQQDNPYVSGDSAGEVQEYTVCGSKAWGFKVTGDFSTGFTASDTSGMLVDQETNVVYTTKGSRIHRIMVPTGNEDSIKILATYNLP